MPGKKRIRIGIYSLTGCDGCQLVMFDLEGSLKEFFSMVEVVDAPYFRKTQSYSKVDIAFVEGAVIVKDEIEKLKRIRKNAKFLVAVGACAISGGFPALRNALPSDTHHEIDELKAANVLDKVHSLKEFVKVDYMMQGCPPDFSDYMKIVKSVAEKGVLPGA